MHLLFSWQNFPKRSLIFLMFNLGITYVACVFGASRRRNASNVLQHGLGFVSKSSKSPWVCWGFGVDKGGKLRVNTSSCTCSDTYALLDLQVLCCLSAPFHHIPEGNEDANLFFFYQPAQHSFLSLLELKMQLNFFSYFLKKSSRTK